MEDNKMLLPVHKQMQPIALSERVDVLLTPQFYTMKKEQLPIKYAFQAKAIAPSLFEGMLQEGIAYEYFVFKQDDAWVFIAYSMEEIMAFLQSKGLATEYVSHLFFAQQIVHVLDIPFALGLKEVLGVIDGTVVILPKSAMADESLGSKLPSGIRPKRGITVHGAYDSVLSRSQALVLASIFLLFAVLFIVEGARYGKNAKAQEKLAQQFEDYPELESQYKRESILKKYQTIDKTERRKREVVKQLASLAGKGSKLTGLHLDDKGFSATFESADAKVLQYIETRAKQNGFSVDKEAKGIKAEGRL